MLRGYCTRHDTEQEQLRTVMELATTWPKIWCARAGRMHMESSP